MLFLDALIRNMNIHLICHQTTLTGALVNSPTVTEASARGYSSWDTKKTQKTGVCKESGSSAQVLTKLYLSWLFICPIKANCTFLSHISHYYLANPTNLPQTSGMPHTAFFRVFFQKKANFSLHIHYSGHCLEKGLPADTEDHEVFLFQQNSELQSFLHIPVGW